MMVAGASSAAFWPASEGRRAHSLPETRLAHGFRNLLNQQRQVRIACTRGYPPPVTHRNHH
jgi:hypothetical protein